MEPTSRGKHRVRHSRKHPGTDSLAIKTSVHSMEERHNESIANVTIFLQHTKNICAGPKSLYIASTRLIWLEVANQITGLD